MRSTEASGVGGKRFGAPDSPRGRLGTMQTMLRRSLLSARHSPIRLTLAATVLLAAASFVVIDASKTLEDAQLRQTLIHALSNAAPLADTTPPQALTRIREEAGTIPTLVDIGLRATGAFALAFGLIGILARRRRAADTPAATAIRHYNSLIATMPFGIACWTPSGKLIVCNDQYRDRLGADCREMLTGTNYRASVTRLVQGGQIHLVGEDASNRVLELRREDGSCLLIDERPLPEGGFITLVTDITERHRTDHLLNSIRAEQRELARRYHEEKLRAEAASHSKTSFLAHLSHDIRTPLNHIIGFADLMRHQTYGPLGDARYLTYIETIKSSGERLLSFFASILDLAELDSGLKEMKQDAFDVDDLLAAVTQRFTGQAQRAALTLTSSGVGSARLLGDRFSLERMLGNLVENAIRFTPPGGKVNVAAYAAANGVVLEVTDTGIGMPAERLASLSQPFAFGDAALTRDREGVGLGLAIARAIAELSGGRLAIDSRPGLGTTVAVSLPLLLDELANRAA